MEQVRVIKEFCNLPVGLVLTLNESTQQYEVGAKNNIWPGKTIISSWLTDFYTYSDYSSIDANLVKSNIGLYFEEVKSESVYTYVKPRVIKSYVDGENTHYKTYDGVEGSMPTDFFNELYTTI